MLKLPEKLSAGLFKHFEHLLAGRPLEDALAETNRQLLSFFSAGDAVLQFRTLGQQDNSTPDDLLFAETRREISDRGYQQTLRDAWQSSGIAYQVLNDLERRGTPFSCSAFSWPYSSRVDREEPLVSLPREYTLCIPFSSSMVVHSSEEKPFFAYIALMFDSFPQLDDEQVAAIVDLPQLLSETYCSIVREEETPSDRLSAYAHDVKQYLLLHQELIHRLNTNVQEQVSEKDAKLLESLRSSLKRMLFHTNSILLGERDARGMLQIETRKTSLNEVVKECLDDYGLLFELANVELVASFASSLPAAMLDERLFPSLVHNLLDNALKYSSSGDKVIVSTSLYENKLLQLRVANTGSKISEDEKRAIFTKYYRGKASHSAPGTGLGLYIVRQIADLQGGNVSVDSPVLESGESATEFVVDVPIAK